jgi:hypothetical protein
MNEHKVQDCIHCMVWHDLAKTKEDNQLHYEYWTIDGNYMTEFRNTLHKNEEDNKYTLKQNMMRSHNQQKFHGRSKFDMIWQKSLSYVVPKILG